MKWRDDWNQGHRSTYLIFAILFLSGASALIYEISWSRQLGILLGHTSRTASIVLAVYFCGMALGYAFAARIASSLRSPLKGYAYAEIMAAAFACLVPPAIRGLEAMNVSHFGAALTAPLLLLPPTAALGATLPFVAEHFSRGRSGLSPTLTTAYACNTAGAVFGVLLATFLLIQHVGVAASSIAAAAAAALAGVIAWGLAARDEPAPTSRAALRVSGGKSKSASDLSGNAADRRKGRGRRSLATDRQKPHPFVLILTLVAVSGAATLGLQVLYTHLFSLVLQNSTYTFGTIIAVFLVALAASSALSRYILAWWSPLTIVGWSCALGSASVAVSSMCFLSLTDLEYFKAGSNLLEHVVALTLLAVQVVAPPVLIIGLVLPTLWFAVRDSSEAGRTVGILTAVNTVAAALGALCMSYAVLPLLGIWGAFSFVAMMLLASACLCAWSSNRRLETIGVVFLLVPLILQTHQGGIPHAVPEGGELVRRWETTYGWVDLIRRKFDGVMLLRQNIHYGLGSNLDAVWEKRQGHLSLLLHPDPKSVCFLGLGTGLSAASAVEHSEIDAVVAVELIPEVVEASKMYPETEQLHQDKRAHTAVGDASHFLKRREAEFDVVVGDLFTPFHSHTGYLYTVEHFRHVRSSLKPGGIYCQWMAMWQVGPQEFEMIANSFASVFPQTTLWWGRLEYGQSMVALVGTEQPLQLDAATFDDRIRRLQKASAHPDPFLASPQRVRQLQIGNWSNKDAKRLNTNEHPRVEFSAPLSYVASQQLRRDNLLHYWDETLSRLPIAELFSSASGDGWPSEEACKQWQRTTLTRRIKRGRGEVAPPEFLE